MPFLCFNGLWFLNTHRRYSINKMKLNLFLFFSFCYSRSRFCCCCCCRYCCITGWWRHKCIYKKSASIAFHIDVNYTLGRQFNLKYVITSSRKLPTEMALPPDQFKYIGVDVIQVCSFFFFFWIDPLSLLYRGCPECPVLLTVLLIQKFCSVEMRNLPMLCSLPVIQRVALVFRLTRLY